MISVNRLERLLEFIVEVDVEFVRRAILSRVISLGVDVSSKKSLSRKKFKIVCRWTCARATINPLFSDNVPLTTLEQSGLVY